LLSRPVRTPDCEIEAPTPKPRHELGGHVQLEASVDFADECLKDSLIMLMSTWRAIGVSHPPSLIVQAYRGFAHPCCRSWPRHAS
jgi:hypothetical protein